MNHPTESIGGVLIAIVLGAVMLLVLGLFVWSLFWVYSDAEKRGKSGCLVTLLVFLFSWPFSLIFWLCTRPDRKK